MFLIGQTAIPRDQELNCGVEDTTWMLASLVKWSHLPHHPFASMSLLKWFYLGVLSYIMHNLKLVGPTEAFLHLIFLPY